MLSDVTLFPSFPLSCCVMSLLCLLSPELVAGPQSIYQILRNRGKPCKPHLARPKLSPSADGGTLEVLFIHPGSPQIQSAIVISVLGIW